MRTADVSLLDGLKIGDEVQREAVIREATLGDLIDATVESERAVPVQLPDGSVEYQLIASPVLVGLHMVRRRIVRIGSLDGPLPLPTIKKLSPRDFNLLHAEAEKLDQITTKSLSREVGRSGKS